MKITPVVVLVLVSGLLCACDSAQQKNRAQMCAQAADFIGLNSPELQKPRDWNRLMTAASRLVYIDNDCGELVTEPKQLLCASLTDAINIFANNPKVPQGLNRDRAISIGTQTYRQSGCEGLTAAR